MLCFTPLILYAESNLLIVRIVQPEHQTLPLSATSLYFSFPELSIL